MSFDRVCFWLERMWRYKNITKVIGDYTLRRFGEIIEVRSQDKAKMYVLIVGRDFIRIEFLVSLSKFDEFFSEVRVLNYYFEGALSPLMWKLMECWKRGDCRNGSGLVKGLYHTISTEGGMVVGVDFVVKRGDGENHYRDVMPMNFRFKGVYSLDRFRPVEEKKDGVVNKVVRKLKNLTGRFLGQGD